MPTDYEDLEATVKSANQELYRAFREQDMGAMTALWAREHMVACIHPGWHVLTGRNHVLTSWRAILENEDSPDVTARDEQVHINGDTAFVICTERVDRTELVATNIFVRENNEWLLVHHQAAPFSRRVPVVEVEEDTVN